MSRADAQFSAGTPDEVELYVRWLRYLRGAVLRKIDGLSEATVAAAVARYRDRATATEDAVRSIPHRTPCPSQEDADLRWVVLHLINETARYAGHADATRELLDGNTGE